MPQLSHAAAAQVQRAPLLQTQKLRGRRLILRRDRVARFGQAGRVIRAGRGDLESKRCALLATWPGLRPMVRRGCRGDEAPGLRILPHPHTMVRPQRIGASHRTRRRRRDGHGRWRGYLVVFNLTESCARFLAFRSSRMRCPNV